MKAMTVEEMRSVEGGKTYTCKACGKSFSGWTAWIKFKAHLLVNNLFNAQHRVCYNYDYICEYE